MDTLTESDVPSPDADWETISNFAILYDGSWFVDDLWFSC